MDVAAERSRPTLATVARIAGVSLPTASKVLNGRPDVATATRRRVESVLQQMNYVPPVRRLRDGAELIDVVFPFLDGSWSAAVLAGIEAEARRAGLAIVLSTTGLPGDHDWVSKLPARRSRGAIIPLGHLTGAERAQLDRMRIPYVVVDPVQPQGPDTPSVSVDNRAGARSAVEHLLGLGHRRIAMIGGPDSRLFCRSRLAGYRDALAAAGLPYRPDYVRDGGFDPEPSRRATLELLDLPEPPTALFLCTDHIVFGVYDALHARGLRVPEDISVAGFDDLPEARWVEPKLTTVRQPLAELAAAATRLIVRLMHGDPVAVRRIELPATLIVRASTATPRECL